MPSVAGQALNIRLGRIGLPLRGQALTRATQPARGVAGHHIALHAGPAHIEALVDLFGIVAGIVLGDAGALLGGVLDLLRTSRQSDGEERQAEQASQSHGTLSLRERIGLVAPGRAKLPVM
jgi:hypothetical protein